MFLRRVLEEAGHPQDMPTPLYEDNRSCRMMSENPVANDRSKHIDYCVHALRERVQEGIVRLLDCPSADVLADALTKNLPRPDFRRHAKVMSGTERHTSPSLPKDLTIPGPRVCVKRHPTTLFVNSASSQRATASFARQQLTHSWEDECVIE